MPLDGGGGMMMEAKTSGGAEGVLQGRWEKATLFLAQVGSRLKFLSAVTMNFAGFIQQLPTLAASFGVRRALPLAIQTLLHRSRAAQRPSANRLSPADPLPLKHRRPDDAPVRNRRSLSSIRRRRLTARRIESPCAR